MSKVYPTPRIRKFWKFSEKDKVHERLQSCFSELYHARKDVLDFMVHAAEQSGTLEDEIAHTKADTLNLCLDNAYMLKKVLKRKKSLSRALLELQQEKHCFSHGVSFSWRAMEALCCKPESMDNTGRIAAILEKNVSFVAAQADLTAHCTASGLLILKVQYRRLLVNWTW